MPCSNCSNACSSHHDLRTLKRIVASTLSIHLIHLIHLNLRAINTSFAQITDFSRPLTVFQITFRILEKILNQPCTDAHPTLILMKNKQTNKHTHSETHIHTHTQKRKARCATRWVLLARCAARRAIGVMRRPMDYSLIHQNLKDVTQHAILCFCLFLFDAHIIVPTFKSVYA
jgi:hypothetical protein